jgi:hypothetical protein
VRSHCLQRSGPLLRHLHVAWVDATGPPLQRCSTMLSGVTQLPCPISAAGSSLEAQPVFNHIKSPPNPRTYSSAAYCLPVTAVASGLPAHMPFSAKRCFSTSTSSSSSSSQSNSNQGNSDNVSSNDSSSSSSSSNSSTPAFSLPNLEAQSSGANALQVCMANLWLTHNLTLQSIQFSMKSAQAMLPAWCLAIRSVSISLVIL